MSLSKFCEMWNERVAWRLGTGRSSCGRICSSVEARLYDEVDRCLELERRDRSGREWPSSVLVLVSRFGTAGGPISGLSSMPDSSVVTVDTIEEGRPLAAYVTIRVAGKLLIVRLWPESPPLDR